ncbi:unnamed protein product [Owenia fusiformis]|uniref:Uncharacterized protein n=1 Tax=Owenia fusiformis TaxID=6347 RepID=A0A8S4NBX1_OWEFU|nr:unnamed protein product [Owenia fusiformis]
MNICHIVIVIALLLTAAMETRGFDRSNKKIKKEQCKGKSCCQLEEGDLCSVNNGDTIRDYGCCKDEGIECAFHKQDGNIIYNRCLAVGEVFTQN